MTTPLPDLRVDDEVLIKREPMTDDAALIKFSATICGYPGWLIGTVIAEREQEVITICEIIRDRIKQDDVSVFHLLLPLIFEDGGEAIEAQWPPTPLCATCGMGCYRGVPCNLCVKWRMPTTKALWQNMSV